MQTSIRKLRTKIAPQQLLFPALFVLIVIAFTGSISLFGWSKPFALFGVHTMEPFFADLRVIAAAVDADDRGLKPWIENPGDPWQRVLNYPIIWIPIFRFIAKWGDPVLIFGMAQLMALLGLGLWLSRQNEGYLAVLLALSPPILQAVERGNNDILVFLLILAGVWRIGIANGFILGLACALKFFPVVAVASVVALRVDYRFLIGVALTMPLILWSFMQLPVIAPLFPSGPYGSFGIKSLSQLLYIFESALVGPERIPRGAASILTVYAAFFIAASFIWYTFRSKYRELFDLISALGPLAKSIAIVFLATFVGIFLSGSNFIYKLLYLTPLIWLFARNVHLNNNPGGLTLALFIFGLIIFYFPLLPHWEILMNPAVFIYTSFITPILMEAGVDGWKRIRRC